MCSVRVSPPAGRALRVKKSSPLASGLIGLWIPRGGPHRDILGRYGDAVAQSGGAPLIGGGGLGWGALTNALNARIPYHAGWQAPQMTFALLIGNPNVAPAGGMHAFGTTTGAANAGFGCYNYNSGTIQIFSRVGAGWADRGVARTLSNTPALTGWTYDGATFTARVDTASNAQAIAGSITHSAEDLYLGHGGIWDGTPTALATYYVAMWDRPFTDADWTDLQANPFDAVEEAPRFYFGGAAPSTVDLTAASIASASSVGTPALGQIHALGATGIASAASVGTPALAQSHALAAASVASAPTVGAPAIGQVHALGAASIAAAPSVGTPALAQAHALAATGIASTTSVGTPALGQVHALAASSIAAASSVGTPALNEQQGIPAAWLAQTAATSRNVTPHAGGALRPGAASTRLRPRSGGALRGPGDPA